MKMVKKYISYFTLVIGMALILYNISHRLFINSHLTEAQALLLYWPTWLSSIMFCILGYLMVEKWTK
jgi:hypothetical protein